MYGLSYFDTWQNGYNFLCVAIQTRHFELATHLLSKDCSININPEPPRRPENTPLHLAVLENAPEIVKILLAKNVDIEATNEVGNTPLSIAIQKVGSREITEMLLNAGASISRRVWATARRSIENCVQNDLYIATYYERFEIVELFLQRGISPNHSCSCEPCKATRQGLPPLHVAISAHYGLNTNSKIIKILLENGADIGAQDTNGRSVLCVAIQHRCWDIVELMLPYCHDESGNLRPTCIKGCFREAVLAEAKFYASYFPPEPSDYQNANLFHAVIERGWITVVEDMLKNGANPKAFHSDSRTPLHTAAYRCRMSGRRMEVTKLLIKYGGDVNARDRNGNTPLHRCLKFNRLYHGKKMSSAFTKDNWEYFEFLYQHGARLDAVAKNGNTILHSWARYQCPGAIKRLIQCGLNVRATRNDGKTPLHIAAEFDNIDCETVNILLRNFADVSATDIWGRTPLHVALKYGRIGAVKSLANHDFDVESIFTFISTPLSLFMPVNDSQVMLIKYCGKLMTLGYKLNQEYKQRYHDKAGIELEYELACSKELERMEEMTIPRTCVSFYDVLSIGFRKIAKIVANERVVEGCMAAVSDNAFPIYGDMMKSRIEHGQRVRKLLDLSASCLNKAISYNLPYCMVSEIFEYLRDDDLISLAKAVDVEGMQNLINSIFTDSERDEEFSIGEPS